MALAAYLVHLAASVGVPAVALVEVSSTRIVGQHPEHRFCVTGSGEAVEPISHESTPGAFSPMGGIHVAAVDLAERGLAVVFIAAGAAGQPAGQVASDLRDEHEGVLVLCAEYRGLPAQRAKREVIVQAPQVFIRDHLCVSGLPGSYVR
jgi:hypothetical protein